MNNGILLALLAYATFSWSDAAIKALGGSLNVFEIGFFLMLVAGICIFFAKPRDEDWRDMLRMQRPWAVHLRALSAVACSVLAVVAFTTIPLAEAYALIFLSPLFVTLIAIVFLHERVGPWRWFAVIAGFAGVLLVVRPGFRTLENGHFAALAIAVLAAISLTLMRSLAGSREKWISVLGFLIVYGLVANAIGMALTSARLPSLHQATILVFAGVFASTGHIFQQRALRFAPANQTAPTLYSQIIWAVIIGATVFDEHPDALALVGLAVITGSGLLTIARERIRLGFVRFNPFGRNRV